MITRKVLIIFILTLSVFLFSSYVPVYAVSGVPTILSYQGRLTNSAGDLLGTISGTSYNFKFSIWNSSTGGTKQWPIGDPTSFALTVRQGVFNVNIGDTDSPTNYPDPLNYNFNTNKDIYLQVEVFSPLTNSFEPLLPRQRISSAPFAKLSGAVSGTGQSSFGTVTPVTDAIVTIASTAVSSIPLLIHGFSGQTAGLLRVENSSTNPLFFIDSGGSVGIGTSAPSKKLDVFDVNNVAQLRLSQASDVYGEFQVMPTTGDLQISSTGGNIRMNNENLYVCSGGSCGSTPVAGQGSLYIENSVIFDNNFKFKQVGTSTIMYDSGDNPILEFDEAGGP